MKETHPYQIVDRPQLGELEGQFVRLTGTVVNVTAPKAGVKLVCIGKPKIARVDNDVPFKDAVISTVDHLWLNVSEVDSIPHSIGQKVETVARVYSYERKDGSKSFSIELVSESHTLESHYVRKLRQLLNHISVGPFTLEQKVSMVNNAIETSKELLTSGEVVLFSKTTKDVIQFLERNRSGIMQMADVKVTLNRQGRRLERKPRPRCRRQSTSVGFA